MKIRTFWLFLFTLLLISTYGIAQDVTEPQPSGENSLIESETNETQDNEIISDKELYNPKNEKSEIELTEEYKNLVEQLLNVNIIVTMIPPGNNNTWTKQKERISIPGKDVTLTIEGETIKFNGSFVTIKEKYNYTLVAMSQIWIKTNKSSKMKFLSTFKMVTFSPGEKILYYPLGLPTNEKESSYSIKIEIDIMPYLDYKARKAEENQKVPE